MGEQVNDEQPSERERVQPEVLAPGQFAGAGSPFGGAEGDGIAGGHGLVAPGEDGEDGDDSEQVTRPTKLIRIASMVRSMLDEVRRAPLDDAGRRRLREIHERSLTELESVLSPDLQQELNEVVLPLTENTPTESELRLAQAQLVGWLEGLFHGIQATLFTQQAMAQSQLEEMRRRRALEMAQQGGPTPPSGYL